MNPGNPSASFPEFPDDANGIDLERDGDRARRFLQGIQGNILKGHGRNNARLVFFRFGPDLVQNQSLLKDAVTDGWVQSAWEQRDLARSFQLTPTSPPLPPKKIKFPEFYKIPVTQELRDLQKRVEVLDFGSLGLTPWGLAAVGCADRNGDAPPRADFKADDWPGSFSAGMRQLMSHAKPPPGQESMVAHWKPPYTDVPTDAIHGLFLLACDDIPTLKTLHQELQSWLQAHGAREVHLEVGTTWRHKKRNNREPFGFVDGISQPVFFAEDRLGKNPADWAWTDLKLRDVFIAPEQSKAHAGGSFLAFLKFEQNVREFRQHEGLIRRLLRRRDAYHHAPAFPLGRWRDGRPLHLAWGRGRPPKKATNSFDYEQERNPQTSGCPFHAHIRKMNPRVDDRNNGIDRDTIIHSQPVRRGMIWDDHGALQKRSDRGHGPWPDKDVGLLFMAYMSDVSRQFERLHNDWAKDPDFPQPGNAQVDGILHAGLTDWTWRRQRMPKCDSVLKRFGGHYFYVPSIPWLERGGRPVASINQP